MVVTLQMISNSRRSLPVINAHLLTDQAGGRYTDSIAESF
jgi:hypothetical protein